jgi:hypothetical protein
MAFEQPKGTNHQLSRPKKVFGAVVAIDQTTTQWLIDRIDLLEG